MEIHVTALDAYFGISPAPVKFDYFDGDIIALARQHEALRFDGLPYADASLTLAGVRHHIQCREGNTRPVFPVLRLRRHAGTRNYVARDGIYQALHDTHPAPEQGPAEQVIFETAVLAARYPLKPQSNQLPVAPAGLSQEFQRDLLELILTGPTPDRGLEVLAASGFLSKYWPELANLATVDHAKEYHPEGDAWVHTLETFRYRKDPDLILSLALLLHDTGKPDAVSQSGRRFDRHSELGERTASHFLNRLGYDSDTRRRVGFLVRYHMLPAALPRMEPSTVDGILTDQLFPTLLELYRCDELSTFRGPDRYYEACSYYQAWRRHSKNPYRNGASWKRT